MAEKKTPLDPAVADALAKKKSGARNAAEARLRTAHEDELKGYLVEEYAKVGLEYIPRLTPAQKAAEEIRALVAKYGDDVLPTQDEVDALVPAEPPTA